MIQSRNLGRHLLLGLVLCLLAVLAGCSSNVRPGAVDTSQYAMVLSAYKDGQFLLDGGVLAGPDLVGHFDYLQGAHALPTSVLLKDGPDSKVRSTQLHIFARLQAKYGFVAWVAHKGVVKPLEEKDD
ncbi:MAG: hypothetical protein L0H70_08840 [Xanthomonadales bacterium]|nr:hypothetical protein [Xanthomonadales bacterium]